MASGSSSRTARGGEQEEEEDFGRGAREGCARRFRRAWRSSGARVAVSARAGACLRRRSGRGARVGGMFAGLVLLLLHGSALASPDETNYEASGSLTLSLDQAAMPTSSLRPSGLHMIDEDHVSVIRSDPTSQQRDVREKSVSKPQIPLRSGSTLESLVKGTNQTNHSPEEGSLQRAEPSFMIPSSAVVHIGNQSSTSGLVLSTNTITTFVQAQPSSPTVPPVATDIMSSSLATPPLSMLPSPILPSSSSSTLLPVLSSSLPSLSSSDSALFWSPLKETKPTLNHSYIPNSAPISANPTTGSYTLYPDKPLSPKNISNTPVKNLRFVQNTMRSPVSKALSEIEPNLSLSPVTHLSGQPSQEPSSLHIPAGYLNWEEPYSNDSNETLELYRTYLTTQVPRQAKIKSPRVTSLNSFLETDMATVTSRLIAPVSFSRIHLSGPADKPTPVSFMQKNVTFTEYTKPKNVLSMLTSSAFSSTSLQETSTDKTLSIHVTEQIAKVIWDVPPTNIPSSPLLAHRIDTVSSETTANPVTLSNPLISAIFSSSIAKQVADGLSSTKTSILLDSKSLTAQNGIMSNFVTTSGLERHIQETYTPINLIESENPFNNSLTYQEKLFSPNASTSAQTPMETRSSFMSMFLGSTLSKKPSDMPFSSTHSSLLHNMLQTTKANVEKSDYFTSSDRRMTTTSGIFTKNALFSSSQTRVSNDRFVDETTSMVSSKQTSATGTGAQGLNITNSKYVMKQGSLNSGFYTTLTLKARSEASNSNPTVTGGFSNIKQSISSTSNTSLSLHMVLNTTSSNESVILNTRGIQVLPSRFTASGINLLSERTASVSSPTMSILAVHTSGTQSVLPPGIKELSPTSSPSASSPSEVLPLSLQASSLLELSPVSSPSELLSLELAPASSPPEVQSSPSKLSPVSLSAEKTTILLLPKILPTTSPSTLPTTSPSTLPTASPSELSLASLSLSSPLSTSELSPSASSPSEIPPVSSTSSFSVASPSSSSTGSSPSELSPASSTSEFSSMSLSAELSTALLLLELSPATSPSTLPTAPPSKLSPASSPSTLPTAPPSKLSPASSPLSLPSSTSELSPSASLTSEIPPASSPSSLSVASSPSASSTTASPSELLPISSPSLLSVALSPSELSSVSSPSELSSSASPSSEIPPASSPSLSVASPSDLSTASSPSELSPALSPSLLLITSSTSELSPVTLPSESSAPLVAPSSSSELSPPASSPLLLSVLPSPSELPLVSSPSLLSVASSTSSLSTASSPSELSVASSPSGLSTTSSPSEYSPVSSSLELSPASSPLPLSAPSSPSELSPSASSPSKIPSASSPSDSSPVSLASSPSELSPVSTPSISVASPLDSSTSSTPSELSTASPLPLLASSPSSMASSPSDLSSVSSPSLSSLALPSDLSTALSSSLLTAPSSPSELSPPVSSTSEVPPPSPPSLFFLASSPSDLSRASLSSSSSEFPPVSSLSLLLVASDLSTASSPSELSPLSSPSPLSALSLSASSPSNLSRASPSKLFSVSSPPEVSPSSQTKLSPASSELLLTELLPTSSPSALSPASAGAAELPPPSPPTELPASEISPFVLSLSPKPPPELSTASSSELLLSASLSSEISPASSPSSLSVASSPSALSTTASPSELLAVSSPSSLLLALSPSELSSISSTSELSLSTSSQSEIPPASSPSSVASPSDLSTATSPLELSPVFSPLSVLSSPSLLTALSSPSELSPSVSSTSEVPPASSPSLFFVASSPSDSSPTEFSPSSMPSSPSSSSLELSSPELPQASLPAKLSPGSLTSDLSPTTSASESLPASLPSDVSPISSPSELSLTSSPSELSPSPPSELLPASPTSELSLTSSPSELSPSPPSELLPASPTSELSLTSSPSELAPSTPSELLPASPTSESSALPSQLLPSYYDSGLSKYSTLSPLTSIASKSPSLSLSFSLKSSLMSFTSSEPLLYYSKSKEPPFVSDSPSKLFSSPSKPSLQFSQISALIPSHLSQQVSEPHLVITEKSTLDLWMSGLPSPVLTSRETRLHAKGNDSIPPFQMISPTLPNKNVNISTRLEPPVTNFPQFTTITTTTASTTTTTTTQPTSTTQLTSTTVTTTSTTTTTTAKPPRTLAPTVPPKWPTTAQRVRISPPRTTTTTQSSPLSCNITDRMWVKTVLSVHTRRNRLDNVLKQNLPKGLTLALAKALNDSGVRAQIESLSMAPNVTVGYYVMRGDTVYTSSFIVEALSSYGMDRLMADIRQYVPMVQAVPIPAAPWRPTPAISLMLKTVLRFVGPGDDVRSCRFAQLMEERLENAFAEAEAKVLSSYSTLSVQILSVSQLAGSPAVSLIYVVRNRTETLNGTMASNLLSRLTAELVGYFLFYPPFITAEPLEYHNLNTSAATKDFWVITVIQDVENSSLEGQYQSFASLMEQRLAELFVVAHQQGARFKRATTVGSYTVQMVGMRRVVGPKNPAELTYYVQLNGTPLPGTTAAKILNTVDSQTMALTLGYFVQLQAEAVVKGPSNNLWIIASVLAPIGIVTIIIIIITAVLCHKNKSDFKTDGIGNQNPRIKTTYRRDMSYYHQPVQGFDYAKQHLGQLGADEDSAPLPQAPLPIRDASLSMDKVIHPDGTNSKKTLSGEIRKSRLPSEDGSAVSVESARPVSVRGSTAKKISTQQNLMKEESKKRTDPYDTSSGSLQLISVKPIAAPPAYSQPASSDRSHDSTVLNGEVNLALKQKSDIEHYRNKLRLKAKRKGYYDFPSAEGNASSKAPKHASDKAERVPATRPSSRTQEYDDERSSTYVKSRRRHSEVKYPEYRSRQSLNSPSPGGTEMDLLVMRERPRKGIRNSGYDTEPEIIEETDVDGLAARRHYGYGQQVKGHSETSTLSSQPSIDEVRQQMHLLLEEAFSLASAGHTSSSRRQHYHQQHQAISPYSPGPSLPYSEGPTSAPDTMSHAQGGLQWVPAYSHDLYQCSLSKPTFRFTQLPEMVTDSPPPPVPPRTGPAPRSSLRRSSSDLGPKAHSSESSVPDMPSQQDSNTYAPISRGPLPPVTTEPVPNHSGNPMTAVYSIPASRPGYPGFFISTPPSSYHSPSWMSYPPEPEDVSSPWTDSVPLPGYAEAFPNPRYPRGSAFQFPWNPSQAVSPPQTEPDQPFSLSADPVDVITPITLSTSALVQAIRDEVAKLAKKQADMFEFQV